MGSGAPIWLQRLRAGPSLSCSQPSPHCSAALRERAEGPGPGKGLGPLTGAAAFHLCQLAGLAALTYVTGIHKFYRQGTWVLVPDGGHRAALHLLSAFSGCWSACSASHPGPPPPQAVFAPCAHAHASQDGHLALRPSPGPESTSSSSTFR